MNIMNIKKLTAIFCAGAMLFLASCGDKNEGSGSNDLRNSKSTSASKKVSDGAVLIAGQEYDIEKTETLKLENVVVDSETLGEIAKLTNLEELKLYTCKISDITPLAGLTNLKYLNLSTNGLNEKNDNKISDITPLANLTNLESLDLEHNKKISDITPLAGLTNLKNLNLGENDISDITSLENFTNSTSLTLYGNEIGDIKPLENLTNLEELDLQYNEISDITPLENLTIAIQ